MSSGREPNAEIRDQDGGRSLAGAASEDSRGALRGFRDLATGEIGADAAENATRDGDNAHLGIRET